MLVLQGVFGATFVRRSEAVHLFSRRRDASTSVEMFFEPLMLRTGRARSPHSSGPYYLVLCIGRKPTRRKHQGPSFSPHPRSSSSRERLRKFSEIIFKFCNIRNPFDKMAGRDSGGILSHRGTSTDIMRYRSQNNETLFNAYIMATVGETGDDRSSYCNHRPRARRR